MSVSTPTTKEHSTRRFSVYVVELDALVLKHRKFREANPEHVPEKPCLYVGMTSLTPDERLKKHKTGIKSAAYVRRYGKWLCPQLYEMYNPMGYETAKEFEVMLATALREEGHAVWQN